MSIELVALAAILWLLIFVPAGYFIRVWLSRAQDSVPRSPCEDEYVFAITSMREEQERFGTALGRMTGELQLMESKLQLMSTEMADFFDKTRKSEERARGHARRVEAAMGDEEGTSEQDQQLLELMEQRSGEQAAPAEMTFESPEAYYAAQRERLGQ